MNSYYINDKQVNYSIFSFQLMKVCKYQALQTLQLDNKDINDYSIMKIAKELYFDYYNDMKNSGVIIRINKINFKVLKGVR